MRIKIYKRRKRICRILRRMAAVTIWIGMLGALGMAWRILAGMSPVRDAGWILAGPAAMIIGYVIGRTVRYIEKRRMFLDKRQRKQNKK